MRYGHVARISAVMSARSPGKQIRTRLVWRPVSISITRVISIVVACTPGPAVGISFGPYTVSGFTLGKR